MARLERITMPQLGESVHEGTISRWLVKPGDRVEEFEPMLEVDTDKVNAEVPAPVSGILKEILAGEGVTVEAGAEIAVVEVAGEAEAGSPAAPVQEPAAAGASSVPAAAGVAAGVTAAAVPAGPGSGGDDDTLPTGEHRYSPRVRMIAAEHGIDLSSVRGTGAGGRVTKDDVMRVVAAAGQAPKPADGPPTATEAAPREAAGVLPPTRPAPAPAAASTGDTVLPLSRARRLIAENMVLSKTTIPHAWQTQEVDMSGVVANRNANKARFQAQTGTSLTFLPYVIKAAVVALRAQPAVNATFNENEIIQHGDIHLGVSIGLEDSLIVPVIRHADRLSISGLAAAVADLANRARNRQIKADELQGGTFTVNNSGTFGTLFSYSVISPGQAGILTMEAIQERPVAVHGMLGIKPMMYLCFSFDHRVIDGLIAGRFLRAAREWLESVTAETSIW